LLPAASSPPDKGHRQARLLRRQGEIMNPPADHINRRAGFLLQIAVFDRATAETKILNPALYFRKTDDIIEGKEK
jgi:hypothetical protein